MSDEKRPSTPGPCNEYKPNGDGGCWNCVYSHREPYDPLAGPTVTMPRALLRDLMTGLYRLGMDEDNPLMKAADIYAYPTPSDQVHEATGHPLGTCIACQEFHLATPRSDQESQK